MRPSALRYSILTACLLSATALPALAQKANSAGSNGAILPGGNSKEPINIEAAKLDYFDVEQKLVYTGEVIATQGEAKLRATTLVIYLMPKAGKTAGSAPSSSSNQVRRMEATGPVTVVSKDQIGTGDRGIYEKSENKVYLLGNVTLSQGVNVTKGDKLTYDLDTSRAVVTGGDRVKSMFMPGNNDDNGSQKKPAPAPKHDASGKPALSN
jgi:lipopolysaccharide export system protein LptA